MARYCPFCGDWDCCEPDCPDHKVRCGCGDFANSCACRHTPEEVAEMIDMEKRSNVPFDVKVLAIGVDVKDSGFTTSVIVDPPWALKRWGDPDSDPLADLQRYREEAFAASGMNTISRLWFSRRTLYRIVRADRTKRQWRRYRGRLKERGKV